MIREKTREFYREPDVGVVLISVPSGTEPIATDLFRLLLPKMAAGLKLNPTWELPTQKVSTLTFIILYPKIRGVYLMT